MAGERVTLAFYTCRNGALGPGPQKSWVCVCVGGVGYNGMSLPSGGSGISGVEQGRLSVLSYMGR